MSLVPKSAFTVERSEDFRLLQTTKAGVRYYVRPLSADVANAIIIGSRDFQFLCGQAGNQCLLVLIRDGKILRQEPKPYGDLENADVMEVLTFLSHWESQNLMDPRNEE